MKKITFINMEISSIAHAQEVRELPPTDSFWEYVEEWLMMGLKVSLQLDNRTGNSSCYVTERDEHSPNANCSMGCWGATVESAVEKVAIALHHSILHQKTWLETREFYQGRAGSDMAEFEQFLEWKRSQNER